jgi:hypothetical protein
MSKILLSLPSILLLSLTLMEGNASASDQSCRELYSQRPDFNSVMGAYQCYSALIPSLSGPALERAWIMERALKTSSFAIIHHGKTAGSSAQREWIDQSLRWSEILSSLAIESENTDQGRLISGISSFWRMSVLTFDAAQKDGLPIDQGEEPGLVLVPPARMMAALPKIKQEMRRAQELAPEYEGYGAKRNEGVMNLVFPERFFPGALRAAVTLLSQVYQAAPRFSMNVIFYAKALKKSKDIGEAKRVLSIFVTEASSNPSLYGSDRLPETLDDLERARKYLAEWN